MAFKYNPLTNQFDMIGDSTGSAGPFLKLDQTIPQTVINDAPIFDKGLDANDAIKIKSGKKLIFDKP
jgi:hypothetical protein